MSTVPDHLLILGVRHPDRRVPDLVDEYVEGPVDIVFHESPEKDVSKALYGFWTLVKNPLAIVVGCLRFLALVASNLGFVLKMIFTGNTGNLTLKDDGPAQGRRAARSLADEHDVEWKPVDMDRVEVVRHLPLGLSVMSWFVVLLMMGSLSLLMAAQTGGIILSLGTFGIGVAVSRAVGDQRRPARDQRMFENIVEACEEGDKAVLITGENHVKGVASHAAASAVEHDTYWLSSTADLMG